MIDHVPISRDITMKQHVGTYSDGTYYDQQFWWPFHNGFAWKWVWYIHLFQFQFGTWGFDPPNLVGRGYTNKIVMSCHFNHHFDEAYYDEPWDSGYHIYHIFWETQPVGGWDLESLWVWSSWLSTPGISKLGTNIWHWSKAEKKHGRSNQKNDWRFWSHQHNDLCLKFWNFS